jgi:hypothetical protein
MNGIHNTSSPNACGRSGDLAFANLRVADRAAVHRTVDPVQRMSFTFNPGVQS